jgi:thioredoxin 1
MTVVNLTTENFQREVLNSDKPVLVDFWASWCGPCRMVSPVVEEIAAENEDIKVGKVDIDAQPELAGAFRVMSIPTLMVFKGGKLSKSVVGARPKAAILSMLD